MKTFKELYQHESRFQNLFGADYREFVSPTMPMRKQVMRLLGKHGILCALEDLHENIPADLKKYSKESGVNGITVLLYDTDDYFYEYYIKFIKYLRTYFLFPFYFQNTPTIRVHCPDSENSNYYPRYHNDVFLDHPPEEINIWLPLTIPIEPQYHGFRLFDVKESDTALSKYDYDAEKFMASYDERVGKYKDFPDAPMVKTAYDKFLAFDSRCIHTAEPMLNHTRVSMDIRILPVKDLDYQNIYESNGRRKQRYLPGDAYHSKHSEEI